MATTELVEAAMVLLSAPVVTRGKGGNRAHIPSIVKDESEKLDVERSSHGSFGWLSRHNSKRLTGRTSKASLLSIHDDGLYARQGATTGWWDRFSWYFASSRHSS
jgi:hypothetical protein